MKFGRLYLSILFVAHSLVAGGQQAIIDSLEVALTATDSSAARVDLLCQLSDRYLAYLPEKAKQYAEDAFDLSQKIGYPKGETLALNRLGEYEFRQSNYARAVQIITRSLQLAEQQNDSTLMEYAYRVIGNINTAGLKRYDTALRYHLKALDIQKRRNTRDRIASSCGSISWIYAMTNKNLDEGHRLADWGIHLADSLQHQQFLAYNLNSKGLLFKQQGELDSSLYYLRQSSLSATEVNDRTVIAYNESIMGEVFLEKGNHGEALQTLQSALARSLVVKNREITKNTYLSLAQLYEDTGDYQKAYQYRVAHEELKDELLSVEIAEKATLTELEFLREKQLARIQELQDLNAQEKQEKLILGIFFVAAAGLMITIIFLAFKISIERRSANELLQAKNNEIANQNKMLQDANESKDKILSIIGHDLRGPVVRLQAILELVSKNLINEEEFRQHLPKVTKQAAGISNTLENLLLWSRTPGLKGEPAHLNLKTVIDGSVALLEPLAAEKNIAINSDVPAALNVHANENDLSVVFRNLINNAIKFTPEDGNIHINASSTDGRVSISIEDTGIGMTPDQKSRLFATNDKHRKEGTQGETGTGLGLILTKDVIDHYQGSIEVESEPDKGTRFTINLPLNSPRS